MSKQKTSEEKTNSLQIIYSKDKNSIKLFQSKNFVQN